MLPLLTHIKYAKTFTQSRSNMNSAERRKQLKKAKRLEKEIKEELKNDIAKFLASYWLSQFSDLEHACKELLMDCGHKGFNKMNRRELIKDLEEAIKELHGPKVWDRPWWGRASQWSDRRELREKQKVDYVSELRNEAAQLMERLMAEIMGIGTEKQYAPEGRKPEDTVSFREAMARLDEEGFGLD